MLQVDILFVLLITAREPKRNEVFDHFRIVLRALLLILLEELAVVLFLFCVDDCSSPIVILFLLLFSFVILVAEPAERIIVVQECFFPKGIDIVQIFGFSNRQGICFKLSEVFSVKFIS